MLCICCSAGVSARESPGSHIVTEVDFTDIFCTANAKTWNAVISYPLFALKQSRHGAAFVAYAKTIAFCSDDMLACERIIDKLRTVFVDKDMHSDAHRFTSDVHSLRNDEEAQGCFVEYVTQRVSVADSGVCKLLFQVWLRMLTAEVITALTDRCNSVAASAVRRPLSDIEQNVLYYICGYLGMKLKRQSFKNKKLDGSKALVPHLVSEQPSEWGHFVDQYKNWVEKQSRGGLCFPVPDFYLMVREFDGIIRDYVSQHGISHTSLNKSNLQGLMMGAFMVQYYWKKLLEKSCAENSVALPALEYLIMLFIRLKCYAIARQEKDRLTHKSSEHKGSKSLRGKLKK